MTSWPQRSEQEKRERLTDWRNQLSLWRNIADVQSILDQIEQEVGRALFIETGIGFWRECWIGCKIAAILGADKIRHLFPADRPDIALMVDGNERLFEITECVDVNRRRGDEYRLPAIEIPTAVPDDELDVRSSFLHNLARISAQKSLIQYPANTELAIYLNPIGFFDDQGVMTASNLHKATEVCRSRFSAVWAIYNGQVTMLHTRSD